jgi:hypothetical protein
MEVSSYTGLHIWFSLISTIYCIIANYTLLFFFLVKSAFDIQLSSYEFHDLVIYRL